MPETFRLVGREALLADIARDASPVLLLHGDPGVGKSDVAKALSELDGASTLATRPETVTRRSGALQGALLTSLGRALAEHLADQGQLERLGDVLSTAAKRVASTRLRGVADAAVAFVQGAARDVFGDTVVDLSTDFVEAARTTEGEAIARRIAQAADADALAVFSQLASAVATEVDQTVLLTLDAVEKLGDDDFRLLRDLVSDMPPGLRLRLVIASVDGQAQRRQRQLVMDGAVAHPIERLDESVVRAWLTDEGLSPNEVARLARTSHGYPLFIIAGVQHVRAGGAVNELQGAPAFVSQVVDNFAGLDQGDHDAAAIAAAFTEPPEPRRLADLLGISTREWAGVESRLQERRLFSTMVNGRAWFHELVRRAVWQEALTTTQRSEVAASVVQVPLIEATTAGFDLNDAIDVARWLSDAPNLASTLHGVPEVLDLRLPELAVAAALLELHEPGAETPALDAESVVLHASSFVGGRDGLEEAARSLCDQGLAVLAENDEHAVIVPVWKSTAMQIVVTGRALAECARPLRPSIVSATFEQLIRPLSGGFTLASLGVGPQNLTGLASDLRKRHNSADLPGDEADRCGLMIRASWGLVPLRYALTFADAPTRDAAVARLQGFTVNDYVGQDFRVDVVRAWPHPDVVSTDRFAAALVSASSTLSEHNLHGSHRTLSTTDAPLGDRLRAHAATWAVIAEHAIDIERDILGLDEPRGFVFYAVDGASVICEVRGSGEVFEVAEQIPWRGPFLQAKIARMANLPPEARVGSILYSSGKSSRHDPVGEVLDTVRKEVGEFNKQQRFPHRTVLLDADILRFAILEAAEERSRVAEAMIAAGLVADPDPGRIHGRYEVLARPLDVDELGRPAFGSTMSWRRTPAPTNSVVVQIAVPSEDDHWSADDFMNRFGPAGGNFTGTHSGLSSGLEDLLDLPMGAVVVHLPDASKPV